MGLTLESIYLLLFIATLVAIVTQGVRIPYTAGLVIAGIAVPFLPFTPRIELSKDLIFIVLLPPLIFEATLFILICEVQQPLTMIHEIRLSAAWWLPVVLGGSCRSSCRRRR